MAGPRSDTKIETSHPHPTITLIVRRLFSTTQSSLDAVYHDQLWQNFSFQVMDKLCGSIGNCRIMAFEHLDDELRPESLGIS
jgi:hypothetical protein